MQGSNASEGYSRFEDYRSSYYQSIGAAPHSCSPGTYYSMSPLTVERVTIDPSPPPSSRTGSSSPRHGTPSLVTQRYEPDSEREVLEWEYWARCTDCHMSWRFEFHTTDRPHDDHVERIECPQCHRSLSTIKCAGRPSFQGDVVRF
jgi:hypothetical protein